MQICLAVHFKRTVLIVCYEFCRFEKNRVVEELKVMRIKAKELRAQTEGVSVLGKLKQELAEYRGILKCGNCHDRQKEVSLMKNTAAISFFFCFEFA